MTLDRPEAERLLTELAHRLDAAGIAVRIHIVGGAALIQTIRPERVATADVDSWIRECGLSTIAQVEAVFERFFPHDEMNPRSRAWLAAYLPA